MAIDWLAAGIRPEESILFVQSNVPEVMELHTYLSMVTQLGEINRSAYLQGKGRAAARER
jgi:tryptophanyl-tRNA synthetase